MKEVVIVSGARTATGKFGGTLSNIPAPELGGIALKEAVKRSGIDGSTIDEVIIGTHFQAGIKANSARQAAIYAGLPVEIPAFTPNKNCGTGLKAINLAAQSIQVGDNEIVAAGGCETMNKIPYLLSNARFGYKMGPGELLDGMLYDGLVDPFVNYHMGITAENVAEKCGITREMQDEFALRSHTLAAKAWSEGKFDADIVPVTIPQRKGDPIVFDRDETFRENAKIEDYSKLKPAFKAGGTVTAGNASGINDGAAVVIMMSGDKAKELGLKPLAKYVASASAGVEPAIMGYAPVYAVQKLLNKTGLKKEDIGLFELNEAFAAQAVACVKDLGLNPDIVNVNGGAIALGHPVGCTGARLAITLIGEMRRRGVRYGIVSLCIGGGQGIATLFELCE
ncbi:MAG TPA: acetyl-CoA C-acetyltransferase [Bacillota bacterium]|jgi:acetyl-CoA C-acetyltransferase|nr:acetyl-CoA C-acetyltransferase [Bacillota bacterium]HRS20123.1 acetyl-CoA C-acetyltransferase [Clostridia bacterium]HRU40602.1 acetyl-CoA C-acetyltransferase [Candidatus Diapherotrites archaeon]HQI16492.1 acetyl-CoA C-acetyltransferase [Bacillota bacterium]HQJ37284.1 acetyl-CoA C-acetyltransferase [Bacillota bacterium]